MSVVIIIIFFIYYYQINKIFVFFINRIIQLLFNFYKLFSQSYFFEIIFVIKKPRHTKHNLAT